MDQAVRLAAPGEYSRAFLDEDPQVLELLHRVRPAAPAFVDSLVPPAPVAPHGADRLTERELDVLRLVAEGLSNADIARRLFVSPGTAKWHVMNLFGKLGVSSRTQAVARGRELKLL